jgi:hypothetical protein
MKHSKAILALILGQDHLQQFFVPGTIALWIAMLTAVASGLDYYRRFNHVLAQGTKPEPPARSTSTSHVTPSHVEHVAPRTSARRT